MNSRKAIAIISVLFFFNSKNLNCIRALFSRGVYAFPSVWKSNLCYRVILRREICSL